MRRTSLQRANYRQIHRDRLRPLRVVEYLDNSCIFEKSPVEIKDEFVISDRDTGELFLTVLFRHLSEKPLASLEICILLYKDQFVTPYQKLPFCYSEQAGNFGERIREGNILTEKQCRQLPYVEQDDVFGQGIYIPLPDSYFRKLQIKLIGVTYADGSKEELGLVSGGRAARFEELNYGLQATYSHVNIFREAEEKHPIRVLPQSGENAWLCCCGQKNPTRATFCETCGRDKAWQMENLQPQSLQTRMQELDQDDSVRILKDKSNYSADRVLISKKEREEKEEQCRQVLQRVAAQERAREHRQNMILPKLLLIIGILLLVIFVLRGIMFLFFDDNGKGTQSSGGSASTSATTSGSGSSQAPSQASPEAEEAAISSYYYNSL